MQHKRASELSIRERRQRVRWAEAEVAWTEMAEVIGNCNNLTT